MNFFPMNAGGGDLVETVLWTNPSPTSSFAGQIVTLSDNISNYDYIKLIYAYNYDDTTNTLGVIYSEADFVKTGTRTGFRCMSTVFHKTASYFYDRGFNYYSDNQVNIMDCLKYAVGASQTTTLENGANIPIKIVGMKKQSGGGTIDPPALVDTVLWSNSSPSSSFSAQTATLSDDVSNYDFIKIKYGYSTVNYSSGDAVSSILTSLEDIEKWHLSDSTQHCIGVLGVQASNNNQYSRNVFLQDVDKIYFGNDYQVATNNLANDTVIPLQIIGVKKTSDNVALNISSASAGTLARYGTVNIAIDLDKDYLLWEALLQNDSTYRAGCYSICKGVVAQIETNPASNYYATPSISGNTLTLTQLGQYAANPVRYGLIQLD